MKGGGKSKTYTQSDSSRFDEFIHGSGIFSDPETGTVRFSLYNEYQLTWVTFIVITSTGYYMIDCKGDLNPLAGNSLDISIVDSNHFRY